MFDLIIKNGRVVSASGVCRTDIAVREGKIIALGTSNEFGKAIKIIDAEGKYVLPGMIDGHVHIAAPFMGCSGPLDFYTASRAAAIGGVTTIIDFTNTHPGDSVLEKIVERKKEMEIAAVDYGIHAKIVEANENILAEIKDIVGMGCPTLKMFTTYRRAGVMIPDEDILRVMEEAERQGARPGVHAEDNTLSEYQDDKFTLAGTTDWKYHYLSKPPVVEALATAKMIDFARITGSSLYIFHLTCDEALQAVRRAKADGVSVYAETCIHYLELDKSLMDDSKNGYRYICSPPLRSAKDRKALWHGLNDHTISVVSSDNCLYSDKEKLSALEVDAHGELCHDYKKVANGVSGLEERLMLLLTDGVGTGRMTISDVCAVGAENPAKLFGLYPQKGVIQPGSDADFVIVDMNAQTTLSHQSLHYGIDSSVYEGKEIKGMPVMTIRRGDVIAENGVFTAVRGSGQFIKRVL